MNRKAIKIALKSIILLALMTLVIMPEVYAGKIQVPQGTEVKVRFDPSMKINSGKLVKGVPLLISLDEPVIIGGKVVVDKGAQGKAEVLEVVRASKPGKPGYIKIGFKELSPKGEYATPEGAPIKLSGEQEAKGKGKKILSYLFIFGLLIKGGQAELSAGQIYTAQVSETIIMESK